MSLSHLPQSGDRLVAQLDHAASVLDIVAKHVADAAERYRVAAARAMFAIEQASRLVPDLAAEAVVAALEAARGIEDAIDAAVLGTTPDPVAEADPFEPTRELALGRALNGIPTAAAPSATCTVLG